MQTKVLISGAYGEANIGDDLLMHVIINWLKGISTDLIILIAAKESDYLKKKYPDIKFISKLKGKVESCDIYILGGGTQFFDFNKNTPKKSSVINRVRLALKTNPLVLIKYFVTKSNSIDSRKIALGLGLGPFKNENYKSSLPLKLGNFLQIYTRDEYSFKICEELNLQKFKGADLCFSTIFNQEFDLRHIKNKIKQKIAVVIRAWAHDSKGEIINRNILNWIKNHKEFDIELFFFSEEKDKPLFENLDFDNFKINIWAPMNQTYQEYLENINQFDFIITTRYHAAVFGGNFSIPTICIGIDPKLQLLTEQIPSFLYLSFNDDYSQIEEYINNVNNNYLETQNQIESSACYLRGLADNMLNDAIQYVTIGNQ